VHLKVSGLLERYGLDAPAQTGTVEPLSWPDERPTSTDGNGAGAAPTSTGTMPAMSDTLSELLSDVTQAYYSGDYQRAVDLSNRILAEDPDNVQAQEYRQKAEDNLLRGVVPDHRIPFDARVAYNRANSLVRAGNYDEAERLYREARDLAARAGIPSWKDVEQALLDIQD